jgi:hypothetical protein
MPSLRHSSITQETESRDISGHLENWTRRTTVFKFGGSAITSDPLYEGIDDELRLEAKDCCLLG